MYVGVDMTYEYNIFRTIRGKCPYFSISMSLRALSNVSITKLFILLQWLSISGPHKKVKLMPNEICNQDILECLF